MRLLHTDISLVISVGSSLTAPVYFGTGIKQGDPSVATLYCLGIESLLFSLHKKMLLSGLSAWPRHPTKYLSAYALLGHQGQIAIVEKQYAKYSQFSSTKLNEQKSVILILGAQTPPLTRFPIVADSLKIS